jgi:serine/threonine-protein kinase RsbW
MTQPSRRFRKREPDLSRFRLIIDSTLSELFVVSTLIRGVCEHLRTDAAQAYSLELCAVEAVTNAIKHAYREVPGHEVTLEVSFTPERLDLHVLDQGLSMPEEQIHRLSSGAGVFQFDPHCLESIPEGGMGLEIIRHEMDESSYATAGGSNCLTLTKFLFSTVVSTK